ncbi:MAG: hypothetical protein MZW92_00945 [Comamonadaceae bacterium]|nr:hypothetical protein [Comamonadaceae bacterium]
MLLVKDQERGLSDKELFSEKSPLRESWDELTTRPIMTRKSAGKPAPRLS